MPKILQLRRGDTATVAALTGAEGELIVDTTTDTVTVHDGSTAGGFALAKLSQVPTALTGLGISDGTVGQVLTTNGSGAFTFADAAGGGGTTTNALTFSTGLSLNSGTTFDGSAAKTVSLATSGASAGTYGNSYVSGSFVYMPQLTVDSYGRITSISTNLISVGGGGGSNTFSNIYVGASGNPPTGGTLVSADSSSDSLYLIAGNNVTLTADATFDSITISASGGGASGPTWTPNTTYGGSFTVTHPTGYATSGSILVIVVVGSSVSGMTTSNLITSGGVSWSEAYGFSNNYAKVFYTYTSSSMGASTLIGGFSGYAMAYAYISTGSSSLGASSAIASTTSASLSNPSYPSNPKIIGVSTNTSVGLNLATVAGPASGGGPTWATGVGFAHPSDTTLSAAVWIGTGSWTSFASPTITSNPGSYIWYVTGIAGS